MGHVLTRIVPKSWVWWNMALIPAFGRKKQVVLCEFTSLVYKAVPDVSQGYIQRP